MASLQFLHFVFSCKKRWVKWVVYWWGNFMLPLNFSPSKFFQRVTRFLKWFPTFALNQIAKHSTLHSTVPFILHKVVFIQSKLLYSCLDFHCHFHFHFTIYLLWFLLFHFMLKLFDKKLHDFLSILIIKVSYFRNSNCFRSFFGRIEDSKKTFRK